MSEIIIKKNSTDYPLLTMPNHYPADRVYLDGDTTKSVQDKVARKADLTNLDLTGTTNTTGSTISSSTFFYLNGTLVRAKTAIANGATFTLNTNYEVVPNGGLNALNSSIKASGEYQFTATSTNMAINLSSIPNIPSGATIIGAILIQKTSASTGGFAILNIASSTISCIDITSGKDYGLRVLYYF